MSDDNDLIEIEDEETESQFNIEEQSEEVSKYGKKKEKTEPARQKFDSAEYMMKKEF